MVPRLAERGNPMKTYAEINARIASGKAVVLTAEEIIDYVDRKGLDAAAREVDVVTTATFGPMCSSGCVLNFGHAAPKIRMSEAWIQDVLVYTGLAAVDVYLGATQLRHRDPANMDYPGAFRYGGGHVIEDLVAGRALQLFALSYGTDEYPLRELRTDFTIHDLNQAIMVNPRNCYQNYNVAVNDSDRTLYTYMGRLEPRRGNAAYSSAGQLSPLLNDPLYETIGIGSSVWLAGARGHVYAEGTQHAGACARNALDVPTEGAGTLALTANMKDMNPEFVRGASFVGYGVSLALGIGVPIPVLNPTVLRRTCIRDADIMAPIVDYSRDYPQKTGRVLGHVSYAELKRGAITLDGQTLAVQALSSYYKAREIAHLLADAIRRGDFPLAEPQARLPVDGTLKGLRIRSATPGEHAGGIRAPRAPMQARDTMP
jgi:L-aspartate semialdehyde sulfurtransferase